MFSSIHDVPNIVARNIQYHRSSTPCFSSDSSVHFHTVCLVLSNLKEIRSGYPSVGPNRFMISQAIELFFRWNFKIFVNGCLLLLCWPDCWSQCDVVLEAESTLFNLKSIFDQER